jgi:hypothetical protein
VENIIENIAMLCELLWVVMQLDLERLKNRADNTEEINIQAQDCAKRMVRLIFVRLNFNLNYFIQASNENRCKTGSGCVAQ